MPLAFVAALVASLALHGAALWLPEVELFPGTEELQAPPPRLEARLLPPPVATPSPVPAPPKTTPKSQPVARQPVLASPASPAAVAPVAAPAEGPATDAHWGGAGDATPQREGDPATPAAPGTLADQAPRGMIRYVIYRGEQFFEVGRAEQRWEMAEGRYRLYSLTETSGLAALIKPIRLESESRGRLGPRGLIPESYRVLRNGQPTGESADFDWSAGQVKMGTQSSQPLMPGSQDLLSLHYHLAYQPGLENGTAFRVATGKKYELFHFDALGEELIQVPAGSFRTLHLQSISSSRTEIWLALDHLLLPVKIRHTDKKGDIYEQAALQLGLDDRPTP